MGAGGTQRAAVPCGRADGGGCRSLAAQHKTVCRVFGPGATIPVLESATEAQAGEKTELPGAPQRVNSRKEFRPGLPAPQPCAIFTLALVSPTQAHLVRPYL